MGLLEFREYMRNAAMLDILKGTPPAETTAWEEVACDKTPSDEESFRPFLDTLEARLNDEFGDLAYKMGMCAREAVANYAVKNNGSDPKKYVTVSTLRNGENICLEFAGAGDSFDLTKICRSGEQCAAENKLLIPSGRGNMLMKAFSSFMAYTVEDAQKRLGGKRLYLGFDLNDA